MQTVSLETARRLKRLGLEWRPQAHDVCCITENILTLEKEVTLGSGRPGWSFCQGPTLPTEIILQWPWLLRLDQVMDEIERLRPGEEISFTAAFAERRLCHVGRHCTGFGPNNTEAAGRALVEIMETL